METNQLDTNHTKMSGSKIHHSKLNSEANLHEVIPYFDMLLNQFENGNANLERAFGHHVHWGYWEKPESADLSPLGYHEAADNLSLEICKAAGIANGQRIFDVGCGFGGTIGVINDRYSDLSITGVNIDARQIARAKTIVKPKNGNQIDFTIADACQLPFGANVAEKVLAVECIHHFESKEKFFAHVERMLVSGGRLVISDYLLNPVTLPVHRSLEFLFRKSLKKLYGLFSMTTMSTYRRLAKKHNMKIVYVKDITANTAPSMQYLKKNVGSVKGQGISTFFATRWYEMATKFSFMKYYIIAFEKLA